jgi:hypothetical protein
MRRGKLGKAASEEDEPTALTAPLDQDERKNFLEPVSG